MKSIFNHIPKFFIVAFLTMIFSPFQVASQEIEKDLESFSKLVISPHIEVELIKGDKEHITARVHGVENEELNIDQSGNKLHVYLEHAKTYEKQKTTKYKHWKVKEDYYGENVYVKVIITYKHLEHIQMRGSERLVCNDAIDGDKLKLIQYGDSKMMIEKVNVGVLQSTLYGENHLQINDGAATEHYIKAYGDNRLKLAGVQTEYTKTTSYGESIMYLYTSDLIRVKAFGESEIYNKGGADIEKSLVLGENTIKSH